MCAVSDSKSSTTATQRSNYSNSCQLNSNVQPNRESEWRENEAKLLSKIPERNPNPIRL